MKCNISKEELIGYLYKEMAPGESEKMEKHLSQCRSCQKELKELAQTTQILRTWPVEEPDLKLVFVQEKERFVPFRLSNWREVFGQRRWAFALAAGVALVLLIFTFLKYDRFFNQNQNVIADNSDRKLPLLTETPENVNNIFDSLKKAVDEREFYRQMYHPGNQQQRIIKDIDIMANIMDAALENQYRNFITSQEKTEGVYLDGLGVVFLLKGDYDRKFHDLESLGILQKLREGQQLNISPGTRLTWEENQSRESLEEFKTSLLEVVGDYSHTLVPLQPAESIVIAVDLDKKRGKNPAGPNRFIIKVKKKDIDAYNRGQIQLAEFREKVEIQEY